MDTCYAESLKSNFLENLTRRYGRERGGVHVSDLVLCLRESFYRKTQPLPSTVEELGFFVDGAARHSALEGLSGFRCEVPLKRWGIVGTVDMLGDYPLEYKSTRARSSLPSHYWRQLKYYCVLLAVDQGYLVVQRLHGEDPWEFYQAKFNSEEIAATTTEIWERAKLLREALEVKNVSMLPIVGEALAWKCLRCKYRLVCAAAR